MTFEKSFAVAALGMVLVAGCGGDGGARTDTTGGAETSAAQPGGAPAAGTGKVIEVKMMTDDQGNNRFEPNRIEASTGDVLHFTLVSGVHNAHFLPDSNANMANLPPATDLLQLPGQSKDVALNFGTGTFYFQCDPHAALGMVGHVTIK